MLSLPGAGNQTPVSIPTTAVPLYTMEADDHAVEQSLDRGYHGIEWILESSDRAGDPEGSTDAEPSYHCRAHPVAPVDASRVARLPGRPARRIHVSLDREVDRHLAVIRQRGIGALH